MNITHIYLVENYNLNKVYIGKTKNPKSRERDHKNKYGELIKFTIIDQINSLERKDWEPLESYWIEQFRQWGFILINQNKGGGGPEFCSTSTKEKLKQPKTKEHKLKISNSLKGKKKSKEHCLNISNNKGKAGKYTRTKELKLNNSIKIKNNKERGIKISNKLKGRIIDWIKHSEETKQKIGLANKDNNNKPILQYDLEGNFIKEWKSTTDASKYYAYISNFNSIRSSLWCCLNNKTKKSIKFKWKYKNE